VALHWLKSQRCGGADQCVEIAWDPEGVHVRDSKNPDGPTLRFTRIEWDTFVAATKDGEFDGPPPTRA
jgi:hypothetical protein